MIVLDEKGLMEDIRCALCTNAMSNQYGCDGNCCSLNDNQLHKIWVVISEHQMKAITENDKLQSVYNKGKADCSLQLIRDMQEEFKDYIERLISLDRFSCKIVI